MNEKDLKVYLIAKYPKENNGCDWKECKNLKNSWNSKKGESVESYISAISNMCGGHLVLGVQDKTLDIVGIQEFGDYAVDNVRHRLSGRMANLNTELLRVEEFITDDTRKTVWVIHVPPHWPRRPVYAHGTAWQRLDDNLIPMREERLEAILSEPLEGADWSAVIVEKASLSDLDAIAIQTARTQAKEKFKNQNWAGQIDDLENAAFLDRARVTAHGQITRAALLLLGKPEASHYLSPHPAQVTWKLDAEEKAYEHFGIPFILSTTSVLHRVRNVSYKLFPDNQLLGVEIQKYETTSILEGLHNGIAHQDYEKCERILVTETADRLVFENAGSFYDGRPEDYFTGQKTPKRYRNRWLADAMAMLGMIDTVGFGIHRMTLSQRKRFLPLQSYKGSTHTHTRLEVLGRPIDEKYTQLLLQKRDLDLDTVILLDRVQKGLEISKDATSRLKREGLIEGRTPHLRVAAHIASATETEGAYLQHKGAEKGQLKEVVLRHLRRFGSARRPELDELLIPMLSSALTGEQRIKKVKNLLSEMQTKDGTVVSEGRGPGAAWRLSE